jgi:glycosyltransferase involved in cell wall biosynthesis
MDGLITVTEQLGKHYAPLVPSLVVEGILSKEDGSSSPSVSIANEGRDVTSFVVFYAGGLETEYGVDLLLKSFARNATASFQLWILGKGELEDRIRDAAKKDSRIVFMGYRHQSEVRHLMNKATVLVNPRPSNQSFTQFSFPSKVVEYMASGRPVVSTRLPGIPADYYPHLFILEKETPEDLCDLLMQLYAMPRSALNEFGAQAKRFVVENKNESSQGQRILTFLAQVQTARRKSRDLATNSIEDGVHHVHQ